jgi:hypothetical protein
MLVQEVTANGEAPASEKMLHWQDAGDIRSTYTLA